MSPHTRQRGLVRPWRCLPVALVAAALAGGITAPSVLACQVEPWTLEDAARRAVLIVDADVTSASEGGYTLRLRQVVKGTGTGHVATIGHRSVSGGGECGGRIALAPGDHVVLALVDPATALAAETAAWWLTLAGTVDDTNLVAVTAGTTIEQLVAGLRAGLPDTATDPAGRAAPAALPPPWFLLSAVATGLLLLVRLDRRARRESDTFEASPGHSQVEVRERSELDTAV